MRVTSLIFLLLLIAIPVFADDLAALNLEEELLIDVVTGNATSSTNATSTANATKATAQANATNGAANSNVANATSITAFMTGSNSTDEAQKNETTAPAENATAKHEQATTEQVAQPALAFARPAVSIGDVNNMRSLIEFKKLQVALAKENKKLLELTVPVPVPTKASSSKSAAKKKHRPTWPKVVSIQGVDGRLSATLSSSAGIETVRVGNNAGPGKVVSITPNKVLVRSGGKNIALKFKE